MARRALHGHLTVQRAGWVDEQGTYFPCPTTKHVVVPASEVSFAEFMDPAALEFEDGSSSTEEKTT